MKLISIQNFKSGEEERRRPIKIQSVESSDLQLIFFPLRDDCLQNIQHQNKLRSKRGLLPFVEFNGEEIADSEFIINTLGEKLGKDMDDGLSQDQRGVQHAMMTMVDNHMHW